MEFTQKYPRWCSTQEFIGELMNRIYRVIWSRVTQKWVVVSEHTSAVKTSSSRHNRGIKSLLLSLLTLISLGAQSAPNGGQVAAGNGTISHTGNTTTILQNSQDLSINWDSFNVGKQETVNFAQPSQSAIAVNRIIGNQGSTILGQINANGQVWLINPNGVVFGQHAQVNVGGLVASTLDTSASAIAMRNGQTTFSGSSTASVINQGKITTSTGGYVAMIGNTVSNQGNIVTPQGATALGGGSQVTVSFAHDQLVGIAVDKSTLDNLAENKQLIKADGGLVLMSAGAHDSVLRSAVNNEGIIEAQTLENHNGSITLLGGMTAGTTTVSGTLDASAPHRGQGGNIDTSAAHVNIATAAKITTKSSHGTAGNWIIDPQDYTIAASGGDITGTQLGSLLNSNNIIILSTQGMTAGVGDINVNTGVNWNSSNTLTLQAIRNVNFNLGGSVTNSMGGTLNVHADIGGSGIGTVVMNGGSINVSGAGGGVNFYYNPTTFGTASTFSNVTTSGGSNFTAYMLVNNATQLQNIATNVSGNYALNNNISAAAIPNFAPIMGYAGHFDGQGYTIDQLTEIHNSPYSGLFGSLTATSTVNDVNLTNAVIAGTGYVGILAGYVNTGATISNVTASGIVTGSDTRVGGLLGYNAGVLSRVSSSATVVNTGSSGAGSYTGGLVGYNGTTGTISNASATGSVTVGQHNNYIGGFAGYSDATLSNSSATGAVFGTFSGSVGGFVGYADTHSAITTSFATGNVVAGDYNYNYNGGFIGSNFGSVDSSYATGALNLPQSVGNGGFIGRNSGNVSNSYATGDLNVLAILGNNSANAAIESYGGFVGYSLGGDLTNDYATGNITIAAILNGQTISYIGGFVGNVASGNVSHSYASGSDAGNYSFNTVATTTADITPLAITVMAIGGSKVYDGTTADSAFLFSLGVLNGDDVSFTNSAANFNNKNVGLLKLVTVDGISASGSDAGNYSFNTSATTYGNIVPRAITVSATGNDKVYDGTVTGSVTLSSNGVLDGDNVNFNDLYAAFDNKNVGNGKHVTVYGIYATGSDAGNYLYNLFATTTANITPLAITVAATGAAKCMTATPATA